jgi:polyisoprenyl-teichoic acid--peptidoglycan teichoic acid transferase
MNPLQAACCALQMRLSGSMEAEIYPGAPRYIGGISYWVPEREAGQQAVEQARR